MDHEACIDAAGADACHLFGRDDGVVAIEALGDAAIGFRVAHAQEAEVGGLAIEVVRELALLFPFIDKGHDLAVDELAQLAPPGVMILVHEGRGRARAVEIEGLQVLGHGPDNPLVAFQCRVAGYARTTA